MVDRVQVLSAEPDADTLADRVPDTLELTVPVRDKLRVLVMLSLLLPDDVDSREAEALTLEVRDALVVWDPERLAVMLSVGVLVVDADQV